MGRVGDRLAKEKARILMPPLFFCHNMTPIEAYRIEVKGKNKWKTLSQNVSNN